MQLNSPLQCDDVDGCADW